MFLTLPLFICRKQSARKEDLKLKFKYHDKIVLVDVWSLSTPQISLLLTQMCFQGYGQLESWNHLLIRCLTSHFWPRFRYSKLAGVWRGHSHWSERASNNQRHQMKSHSHRFSLRVCVSSEKTHETAGRLTEWDFKHEFFLAWKNYCQKEARRPRESPSDLHARVDINAPCNYNSATTRKMCGSWEVRWLSGMRNKRSLWESEDDWRREEFYDRA